MKLLVRRAETRGDVLRCRRMVAEVYNRDYDVVFSEDGYDLEAKIEPWPHRFLMALAGRELVAACGLYERDTYVERFGRVMDDDVRRLLAAAGAAAAYDATRKRELTKLSVAHAWRGRGLSHLLIGAAHSRHFTEAHVDRAVMVFCATRSIVDHVFHPAGIHPRTIKPFPCYRIHERYRSAENPMESLLVLPHADVPTRWRELALPVTLDVTTPPAS